MYARRQSADAFLCKLKVYEVAPYYLDANFNVVPFANHGQYGYME